MVMAQVRMGDCVEVLGLTEAWLQKRRPVRVSTNSAAVEHSRKMPLKKQHKRFEAGLKPSIVESGS